MSKTPIKITIHPVTHRERDWVDEIYRSWGADFIVTRGRKVFAADTEGFYAADSNGEPVGLLTYQIDGDECEIITLDAFDRFQGIGTALLQEITPFLGRRGIARLWLITTNDNIDAIRFYQRRGFTIAAVHVNALDESRRLKPSISKKGMNGIPLRDEIEFELWLGKKESEK